LLPYSAIQGAFDADIFSLREPVDAIIFHASRYAKDDATLRCFRHFAMMLARYARLLMIMRHDVCHAVLHVFADSSDFRRLAFAIAC